MGYNIRGAGWPDLSDFSLQTSRECGPTLTATRIVRSRPGHRRVRRSFEPKQQEATDTPGAGLSWRERITLSATSQLFATSFGRDTYRTVALARGASRNRQVAAGAGACSPSADGVWIAGRCLGRDANAHRMTQLQATDRSHTRHRPNRPATAGHIRRWGLWTANGRGPLGQSLGRAVAPFGAVLQRHTVRRKRRIGARGPGPLSRRQLCPAVEVSARHCRDDGPAAVRAESKVSRRQVGRQSVRRAPWQSA